MSQQRMAGSNQFQKDMNTASTGAGGQFHKTKEPGLVGDNAWDAQVEREGDQMNNPALIGAYNGSNIKDYADISKKPTQDNGSFSIDTSNKYVNNARSQSLINKQNNSGFSANRVTNNVNFANAQMDNNMARNEGFAMKTTNNFVNNAKNHREDNTSKATQFANQTVDKYIAKNKGNQSTNVAMLDQTIRSAPINDRAYATVQGNNTYGDMYSYGRKELPAWKQGESMKGQEMPDFNKMYNQTKDDLNDYKI